MNFNDHQSNPAEYRESSTKEFKNINVAFYGPPGLKGSQNTIYYKYTLGFKVKKIGYSYDEGASTM